jgi:Mn-dependent DtxR family transcriptional regulator
VPAAIAALTEPPDHYPSPVDVANRLGIARQVLHARLQKLERAGLIERHNCGYVIKIVASASLPDGSLLRSAARS